MAIREASPLGHRSTLPAGGRVPWVCQGLLVERLVRPFMVELLAKDVSSAATIQPPVIQSVALTARTVRRETTVLA